MTRPQIPPSVKRYLIVSLPLLAGVFLGAVVLSKPSGQAPPSPQAIAPSPSPSPVIQVSPLVSVSPKVVKASPSPKPTAKPAAKAVNPADYTDQQKAINQQAKARLLTATGTVDSLIEMKVAIAEGVTSTTVATSSNAVLMDKDGHSLHQIPSGKAYSVQANGNSISFGPWQVPGMVLIDPGVGQVFQLGDRIYRGRLLLAADKGAIWGVNYINMRQYLHSVVGSEVSASWPMEALKAQSVAARSYALVYYFKPVSPLFHLGATEYYQVYSGIEREADRTRQAVDSTAGEFVSYRGGIVESLYAASDDIVAEAFRGRGMSQLGALNLAEQGYVYKKILANYYPGTGVGRVEEDYN